MCCYRCGKEVKKLQCRMCGGWAVYGWGSPMVPGVCVCQSTYHRVGPY